MGNVRDYFRLPLGSNLQKSSSSGNIGFDFFLKKANSRGARIFIQTLFSMYRVFQKK